MQELINKYNTNIDYYTEYNFLNSNCTTTMFKLNGWAVVTFELIPSKCRKRWDEKCWINRSDRYGYGVTALETKTRKGFLLMGCTDIVNKFTWCHLIVYWCHDAFSCQRTTSEWGYRVLESNSGISWIMILLKPYKSVCFCKFGAYDFVPVVAHERGCSIVVCACNTFQWLYLLRI